MEYRLFQEELEEKILSPLAAKSAASKGRLRPEEKCDFRTDFQRDRDRIIHCKAFRRMKHKTQVFISPEGDHYRTRLTHTLEVAQIARTIARALRLNEDLTEAIALGHDLGHTPFGHAGERKLDELCKDWGGFAHNEQSLRVADRLEKDGKGLNLTWEVRDGILNHRTSGHPATLEGKIVQLSDKIAYINHDIDDALRAGILKEADVPAEYREVLGDTIRERLNALIHDIVIHSQGKDDIVMSPEMEKAMRGMRNFLFENVYHNPLAKREEKKVRHLLQELYQYYIEHPLELSEEYLNLMDAGQEKERVVCDYIAGMTDQYAMQAFADLYIPKAWPVK